MTAASARLWVCQVIRQVIRVKRRRRQLANKGVYCGATSESEVFSHRLYEVLHKPLQIS